MSDTIIAKFDAMGGEWIGHFADRPQVGFGGDLPVVAIRRLLEGTESAPDTYTLECDRDLIGSGIILRSIIWDPPELLFRCPGCDGRGEYVGLHERERCRRCGGRGRVPV